METLTKLFHFLTDVKGMIQWGGYFALAAIVFTETGLMFGFFLPGDSLLVTAGLFAAQGHLNIVYLNVLLIVMAIAGDATGYYIGKKLGPALFRRKNSRLFKKEHLIRTQLFYEEHGGKTIIIARFVPIIRTFAPVVAGIADMPYRRFALFNITGGVGWVLSMTMIGYVLGKVIPNIEKYIEVVIIVVILLSLLPGVIEHQRARKKKIRAEAAFRALIRDLVERVKKAQWSWSKDDVAKIVDQLELSKESKAPMRTEFTASGVTFIELTADVSPHPDHLSEAAFQHSQWDYAAKFRHAVETATEILGAPEKVEMDDHQSIDAAAWLMPEARLTIHHYESREHPFRITLVIEPR